MPLSPTGLFVARHCEASFLSLWGMSNPVGKHSGNRHTGCSLNSNR
jgi:hypothetical protein